MIAQKREISAGAYDISAKAVTARTPIPTHATTSGSYAGSLNMAGSSKPGSNTHPDMATRNGPRPRSVVHSRIPREYAGTIHADHDGLVAISG